MIVVATIGILAAVAIPAYQDYTVKSPASAVLILLDGLKPLPIEAMSQSLICSTLGAITSGKYVANITATPSGT